MWQSEFLDYNDDIKDVYLAVLMSAFFNDVTCKVNSDNEKAMLEEFVEGLLNSYLYSVDEIHAKAIEWGLKNNKTGKPFDRSNIGKILADEFYIGIEVINKGKCNIIFKTDKDLYKCYQEVKLSHQTFINNVRAGNIQEAQAELQKQQLQAQRYSNYLQMQQNANQMQMNNNLRNINNNLNGIRYGY